MFMPSMTNYDVRDDNARYNSEPNGSISKVRTRKRGGVNEEGATGRAIPHGASLTRAEVAAERAASTPAGPIMRD